MRARIFGVAAVGVGMLAVTVSNQAAPAAVTLGVAGRANANVSLAAQGNFVEAVWSGAAPGGATDIFSATSRDGGKTFSAPVRVNSKVGDARVNGEQPPRVALRARSGASPEVAVVWTTKGASGTVLLSATSVDGGRTFAAQQRHRIGQVAVQRGVVLDHRQQRRIAHQHGAQ